MSSKASLTGQGFAFAMTAASIVTVSAIVASKPSVAQTAPAAGTTSIERGSEAQGAFRIKEQSFQTREERLDAMPLDWNSTIGTPSRTPSPADEEALRQGQPQAQPGSTRGGAPEPNADEEARKLHPEDWK